MVHTEDMNKRTLAAVAALALIAALSGCGAVKSTVPESTVTPITFADRTFGDVLDKPEPVVEAPVAPPVEIPLDESGAPVEQQQAPAPQPPAPAPAPAPEPPAPVRCPAGSVPTESDGYNDLACTYEVCFTITVPDPAHPECDSSFRP